MLVFGDLWSALVVHPLFLVLLVLRPHIVLVVVMLLSVAQSIRVLTHGGLNLFLPRIQVILRERSLTVVLQEAIASHR